MNRRHWWPCRVCGTNHMNPMSSSICPPCGAAEREESERVRAEELRAYEESAFGQFMSLPEDERWRRLFERIEALEDSQ